MKRIFELTIFIAIAVAACLFSDKAVFADYNLLMGGVFINEPNTPPAASSVVFTDSADNSPIDLISGDVQQIKCTTTVTDADYCENLTMVMAVVYRSGLGTSCVSDKNNCYAGSWVSCTQDEGSCMPYTSDPDATYTCSITGDGGNGLAYYADATGAGSPYPDDSWSCYVLPYDMDGSGTGDYATTNVNAMWALGVSTPTISYGTMQPNSNTGVVNQTATVSNYGNMTIDIDLYGSALDCGGGRNVSASNQKVSMSPFTYSEGTTTLSGSEETPTHLEFNLAKGEVSTKDTYWGLALPSVPAGVCSGSITFIAIQD